MISSYSQTFQLAWWNLTHRLGLTDIADILIVAVIIYSLIMLTRRTRGSAVLKGLILLSITTVMSVLLGMTALSWLMTILINNGALVLIIIFQPELRRALESLGRSHLFGRGVRTDEDEKARAVKEIVQCLQDLSRRRVGALIVMERETGLKDIIETGTTVDARISAALLENIFEPNTPLHDGAVIVRGTRIVAAACILPLTESDSVSQDLGTRHRASLGISETTDAVALIVSEETGIISVARQGRLNRHQDSDSLQKLLNEFYSKTDSAFGALIHRGRKEAEGT